MDYSDLFWGKLNHPQEGNDDITLDDKAILYFTWIATAISLVLLIPKDQLRLAMVAFLFKQFLTCILGVIVANMGWIEYPVRFFANATKTSVTFEFLFYPSICAIFNAHFPEDKPAYVRAAYYILYCTAITAAESILHRYTDLIRYIHWNESLTWITLFITFYLSRQFCRWFFKINKNKQIGFQ